MSGWACYPGLDLYLTEGERLMTELDVRIVRLESMRVAYALGFGTQPEQEAWEKILAFTRSKGLLEDREGVRFFGFNNPNPSPGSPNYGYEQWMTVAGDVEPEGDVKIRNFPGGLYAVTRFKGLENIGRVWRELVEWVENSKYAIGPLECLEELLVPPDVPFEEYVFDLYLSVVE
jgi:effector-binding domain-containing protein